MSYTYKTMKRITTIGIENGELIVNDVKLDGALLYLWDIILDEKFKPPLSVGSGRGKRWKEEIKGALYGRSIYIRDN